MNDQFNGSLSRRNGQSNAWLWAAAGLGGLMAARALLRRAREFDFKDKTVLITGGSRGLGLVLARELAAAGARLAICARDPHELERARAEIGRASCRERV